MSEPTAPVLLRFDHASLAYGRDPGRRGRARHRPRGEAVALIGPNGAGKSTLLRRCSGWSTWSSGGIEVLGTTPAGARREVAYVPQVDTLDAQFPVSVGQVVLMGRYRDVGWLRRPSAGDRAHRRRGARRGRPGRRGRTTGSARCPAASGSGCCWPGRSPSSRGCCCWTSRSTGWTRSASRRCWRRCGGCRTAAPRSSSPPTTSPWPTSPATRSACSTSTRSRSARPRRR